MSLGSFFLDSYRILIFVTVQLMIAVSNSFLLQRPKRHQPLGPPRRVSILVPARNEAATIGACVNSLLGQDYPEFEVIVLNDQSQDRTGTILAGIASERLQVIDGAPVPDDWTGKNWACHQLAQRARGELMLFTDADTVFQPYALSAAVAMLEESNADMLTAIVRNVVPSLGEQITVPFLLWSIMAILPLGIAQIWRRSKALVAANGKFLLFSRNAYEMIGGHRAVKEEAAEDLALSRLIKGAGMKWRLIDGTGLAATRMYDGFLSAWRGFSKNFFAIFDYRLLPALFVWFWMLVITYHPLLTAGSLIIRGEFGAQFWAAVTTVGLSFVIWVITAGKMKLPLTVPFLYPITTTVASAIGITSLFLAVLRKSRWKGRRLPGHRIRLV
ncbi:MAG: glycosyltransferase [candidate division WOR-3 bacterium]